MRLFRFCFLSSLAIGIAQGATVFQGAAISNSQSNSIISDSGWPSFVAGYVTVTTAGILRSVEFAGFTDNGAAPQTFDIAILLPDGAAGSPQRPGSVLLAPTALIVDSKTLLTGSKYRYQADLPADVPLAAGDYWVSIVDTTPGATFNVTTVNQGGGSWVASSATDQTSGYTGAAAQLIQMNGRDVRSVPEPGPALLSLAGLALLARRRRS